MNSEPIKLADLDLTGARALGFQLIQSQEVGARDLQAVLKRISELEAEVE